MKVRVEIDKINGKAFNIELNDSYYDELREFLIKQRSNNAK